MTASWAKEEVDGIFMMLLDEELAKLHGTWLD